MMIPIGHENFVETEKIVTILRPDSSPIRALRQAADETGILINATSGRKTRSVIVLVSNHVVLSSLQPEAIRKRLGALMRSLSKGEQHPQLSLFDSAEKSPTGGL